MHIKYSIADRFKLDLLQLHMLRLNYVVKYVPGRQLHVYHNFR